MSKLHIGTGVISNNIYCGTINSRGLWKKKQDLTIEALVAVAGHALRFKSETGEDVIIKKITGEPEFKITVERL